ncbi:DUF4123 domain-containing protein [Aquitalea denitrificans]|uniref:DUF4123 domain-containing protein n=1 Tax=Aquitalea denitrificans TaxID=519081 RepID=UPI0013586D93|nr:DUF4123 domain-containing protein [Aquitalea denitrificans]
MYFAMDEGNIAEQSQKLETLLKELPDGLYCYALLDDGFDFKRRKIWQTKASWPLYHLQEWGELREVSPRLLALHPGNQPELQQLLRHCKGRPMLSFLTSQLSAPALRDAWQCSLNATTEDGQWYVVRFADTRIAASLPQVLATAAWQRLCEPVEQWLVIDRHSQLRALPMPPKTLPPDVQDPWLLSTQEFTALMHASQADVLADQLHEGFSDLLPTSGAVLYGWLQRTADLLAEHYIEDAPEQLTVAVAVCYSQGRLLDDPRLIQMLKSFVEQRCSLSEGLAPLLDDAHTS